jgi:shikimate dehydrogenase
MTAPDRQFLTGRARIAGVMGWPVDHSKSPALHGFWLREHRIDGAYVPLAVAPHDLAAALRGLAALGFRGANLTIPHKEPTLALVDVVDDLARRVGAVNCVTVVDGRLHATNTDAFGFMANLRQGAPHVLPSAAPAVVLGAGGAARAVCVALADAGCPEIRIVNRTGERAAALVGSLGKPLTAIPWKDRAAALADVMLLVNTTSLGMQGQPPLDIDLAALPRAAAVNDIVYAPLETPLLAAARARGNIAVDGLGMLLHQAQPAFAAWFGVTPTVSAALRAHVLGQT